MTSSSRRAVYEAVEDLAAWLECEDARAIKEAWDSVQWVALQNILSKPKLSQQDKHDLAHIREQAERNGFLQY